MARFIGGAMIGRALHAHLPGGGNDPARRPSFSVIALVVGGIPTGLGFLLLRGGLTMFRGRRRTLAPGEAGYGDGPPS